MERGPLQELLSFILPVHATKSHPHLPLRFWRVHGLSFYLLPATGLHINICKALVVILNFYMPFPQYIFELGQYSTWLVWCQHPTFSFFEYFLIGYVSKMFAECRASCSRALCSKRSKISSVASSCSKICIENGPVQKMGVVWED